MTVIFALHTYFYFSATTLGLISTDRISTTELKIFLNNDIKLTTKINLYFYIVDEVSRMFS